MSASPLRVSDEGSCNLREVLWSPVYLASSNAELLGMIQPLNTVFTGAQDSSIGSSEAKSTCLSSWMDWGQHAVFCWTEPQINNLGSEERTFAHASVIWLFLWHWLVVF